MTRRYINVAVPWSLSHYIPLDGFHPLFRALFDHAPEHIRLSAWDNVKLSHKLQADASVRKAIVEKARMTAVRPHRVEVSSVESRYQEYFWPPDQVLTAELEGDIEFYHTAPYPSLTRPFVFHCESFAPILFPFAQQGSGVIEKHKELKKHYGNILGHPFCLGIFSHVPDTLRALSRFFSDPVIDGKLFASRTGLSTDGWIDLASEQKPPLAMPRFLFVNSANQNPENFYRRGGHLVLRFWKEFVVGGRAGRLIMRCGKPSDMELHEHGVDAVWVTGEIGKSIIWDQGYLAGHEVHSLMASAHFVLMPSVSLHSVSIMEAMRAGAIPVVSDTVGTSVYVTDEEDGIVLHGVHKEMWHRDEATDILVDRYRQSPDLNHDLVTQITTRVGALLDNQDAYWKMQRRTMIRARTQFPGTSYAEHFWNCVSELYAQFRGAAANTETASGGLMQPLRECIIQHDEWSRVFESPTQPMLRIKTEFGAVWELGGAMVQTYGNPCIELNDWSVLAQYYKPSAPAAVYAKTVEELEGKYLHPLGGRPEKVRRKLVRWISATLRPFPILYNYAAKVLTVYRRHGGFTFARPKADPEVELVRQGVAGYNIIRHRDRYYAILQAEGEFSPEKADADGYSSCYRGHSVDEVLRSITVKTPVSKSITFEEDAQPAQVIVEGFHNFNIVRQGKEFYAILQNEGECARSDFLLNRYDPSFSGPSLEEVQRKILAIPAARRQV